MKARVLLWVLAALTLAGCGGVRDRIHAQAAPASTRFDARELVDVLPAGRILAVDQPTFEPPGLAASWLQPDEPVVVVALGQDARAYPLAILVWHEIVNDTIGGAPVAITYSPLANAAVAFDRRVGGRAESFGVSGKLYRSNLVMVDRRTTTLWTQLDGRAVAGPSKGARLSSVPAQITSLAAFRSAFPAGSVLARPNSGRAYGFNPYAGYDSRTEPFSGFIALAPDRRLPQMDRVLGAAAGGESRAVRYTTLREQRVVTVVLDRRPIVAFWEPGTRSALDTTDISEGHDVGSVGVFDPLPWGGFSFDPSSGSIRDGGTRSTWSALGVATSGPLKGTRLTPLPHVDAFWFAWAAFYPGTST